MYLTFRLTEKRRSVKGEIFGRKAKSLYVGAIKPGHPTIVLLTYNGLRSMVGVWFRVLDRRKRRSFFNINIPGASVHLSVWRCGSCCNCMPPRNCVFWHRLRGINWKPCAATGRGNIRFGLTSSGGSASFGATGIVMGWKSSIITFDKGFAREDKRRWARQNN